MKMIRDELYHHGVKGMKWGVRRYRNRDGSLNDLGKERERKQNAGIYRKGNGKSIIKKGSVIRRYSSNPNETFDKPKYASLTDHDDGFYKRWAFDGKIGNEKTDDIWVYTMTAKHDLKVADGDRVVKTIVKKYGDKSLKQAYKDYKRFEKKHGVSLRDYWYGISDDPIHEMLSNRMSEYETYRDVQRKVRNLLYDKGSTDVSSKLCKHYERRGYDAIVDVEDWLDGMDYPILLLNPEKSVKHAEDYEND